MVRSNERPKQYSSLVQLFLIMLVLGLLPVCSALAQDTTTNQVPNFQFRGTSGEKLGAATGDVPALWRSFALEGGDTTTELVPLAANALYPGSPPTNAVRYTVNTFSPNSSEAFDSFPTLFSLTPGGMYVGSVYLRSDNADNSNQSVTVNFPLFDPDGTYLGVEPGNFIANTIKASWTKFSGPQFTALGPRITQVGFRVNNDGGNNSVLIALPEIIDAPLENRMLNPGLEGTGGFKEGNVTGPVPDFWRGFGVNPGAITTAIVPLAADALYPGSPATNAIQLTVNSFGGGLAEGLDQTPNYFSLGPAERRIWSEAWIKSANGDSSPQQVLIQVPVYDEDGVFLGQVANQYTITATTDWNYFGGSSYKTSAATVADMSFRVLDDGGDDSILIALPRVNGVQLEVFADGFEDP